jgi:hypothetical protein
VRYRGASSRPRIGDLLFFTAEDSKLGEVAPEGDDEDADPGATHGHRLAVSSAGSLQYVGMDEVIFEITQEADGGFVAERLTEPIFAEADSWVELRAQVQDAVRAYFFDRPVPQRIRLHLVRDELLATG